MGVEMNLLSRSLFWRLAVLTLVSILFLPIAPFLDGGSVLDLRNDTIHAAIIEANRQGLF